MALRAKILRQLHLKLDRSTISPTCFRLCRALGLSAHPPFAKALANDEDPTAPIAEVYSDMEVGPAGIRAFCAALLGRGIGMKPTGYKHIRSLRLWRAGCGDAGVSAVVSCELQCRSCGARCSWATAQSRWCTSSSTLALPACHLIPVQAEVLRNGKTEVPLTQVEFMDCGVGPEGAAALGQALMLGANSTLEILRLDLNPGIGDAGVAQLCRGLRTNRSLKRLTLGYCGVGPDGAAALASVLESPLCGLEKLDLMGNALGSEGLHMLATAAYRSKTLVDMNLRDNGIGSGTLIAHVAGKGGSAAGSAAGGAAGGTGSGIGGAGGGESTDSLSLGAAGAGSSAAGGAGGPAAPDTSHTGVLAMVSGTAPPPSRAGPGGIGHASAMVASLESALAEAAATTVAATKAALEELGRALQDPSVPLHSVDLEMNGLTAEEASALVPFIHENTKVQVLRVDTTLPADIFAVLCRSGAAKKGGKKGKKGGKKKK